MSSRKREWTAMELLEKAGPGQIFEYRTKGEKFKSINERKFKYDPQGGGRELPILEVLPDGEPPATTPKRSSFVIFCSAFSFPHRRLIILISVADTRPHGHG